MKQRTAFIINELCVALKNYYRNKLVALILFGSNARGDETSESDIDVLVVLTGHVMPCEEIDRTSHIVAGISLEYNVVISCVFVSENQYKNEKSPLLLNIRREGVAV